MKTELYIENRLVDLTADVNVPITFSVADIRNPDKRRNAYSKTVRLPGTKRNNEVFGHAYNLQKSVIQSASPNIGSTFNRKKHANFNLIYDGVMLMSGIAQLTSVQKIAGQIEYNIVLYSELTSIFTTIADKELQDLDGTELQHQFTIETILDSWSGSDGYVYPIIDHGVANTKMESTPMENIRPAVFAHWYWDKIFDEAEFTYSGSFFANDIWDKLIIPHNKERIVPATEFDPTTVTNVQFGVADTTPYFPFNNIIEDPDELYSETEREYSVPEDAKYDVIISIPVNIIFNPDVASSEDPDQLYRNLQVDLKMEVLVNDSMVAEADHSIPADTYIHPAAGSETIIRVFNLDAFGLDLNTNDKIKIRLTQAYDPLNEHGGSAAQPFIYGMEPFTPELVDGNIIFGFQEETSLAIIEPESLEGSTLKPSQILTEDMKQRDFITGILKLFNLYIVPDKDKPRHMNIYTRDEYYADPTNLDWTEKLDTNRRVGNEALKDGLVKTLQFRYKPDEDDHYLQLYKRRWGKDYGELRIDTGYEFSSETRDVLKLPFGTVVPIQYSRGLQTGEFRIEVTDEFPSVMQVQGLKESLDPTVGQANLYLEEPSDLPKFVRAYIGRRVRINDEDYEIVDMISPWRMQLDRSVTPATSKSGYRVFANLFEYSGNNNEKVVPAITKQKDDGINFTPYDSELRICIFNGTVPAIEWTIQQTPRYIDGYNVYRFKGTITKSTTITDYPFVSHVIGDSPAVPDFDMLFKKPEQIFWAIGVTYIVDEFGNNIIDENGNFLIA